MHSIYKSHQKKVEFRFCIYQFPQKCFHQHCKQKIEFLCIKYLDFIKFLDVEIWWKHNWCTPIAQKLCVSTKFSQPEIRWKFGILHTESETRTLTFQTKFVSFASMKALFKMMKNAFCFILKALFVLKVIKFLFWLFGHVEKTALLER